MCLDFKSKADVCVVSVVRCTVVYSDVLLTGDSCAIPMCIWVCWAESLRFPGSSPAAETSIKLWCRNHEREPLNWRTQHTFNSHHQHITQLTLWIHTHDRSNWSDVSLSELGDLMEFFKSQLVSDVSPKMGEIKWERDCWNPWRVWRSEMNVNNLDLSQLDE